jgi:hypothetical protein
MAILRRPKWQSNTVKVLAWIEEQFQVDGHERDLADSLDSRVPSCDR